jgi:hypothetical protein
MTRHKRILLAVLLPVVLAVHAWLIWLGGGWRIFAIVEALVGLMLAGVLRDIRKLDRPASPEGKEGTTKGAE